MLVMFIVNVMMWCYCAWTPMWTWGELYISPSSQIKSYSNDKLIDVNSFWSYYISRAKPAFKVHNNFCLESTSLLGDGEHEAPLSLMPTWRQRWEWSTQSSAAAFWSLLFTQRVKVLQSTQVKGIVELWTLLDINGHLLRAVVQLKDIVGHERVI